MPYSVTSLYLGYHYRCRYCCCNPHRPSRTYWVSVTYLTYCANAATATAVWWQLHPSANTRSRLFDFPPTVYSVYTWMRNRNLYIYTFSVVARSSKSCFRLGSGSGGREAIGCVQCTRGPIAVGPRRTLCGEDPFRTLAHGPAPASLRHWGGCAGCCTHFHGAMRIVSPWKATINVNISTVV